MFLGNELVFDTVSKSKKTNAMDVGAAKAISWIMVFDSLQIPKITKIQPNGCWCRKDYWVNSFCFFGFGDFLDYVWFLTQSPNPTNKKSKAKTSGLIGLCFLDFLDCGF